MTFREFVKELSTIGGWKLTLSGAIRRETKNGKEICPICAVYNKRIRKNKYDCDVEVPVKRLGLKNFGRIMTAADTTSLSYDKALKIRQKLLKACKLV